jgi:uncharacterized SAM-binding protein YcdF (DUF218 family)
VDTLIVLAHEMSSQGVLEAESQARADLVGTLAHTSPDSIVITPGWAYRADSLVAIGDVMREYLTREKGIPELRVISEVRSKDTVGDAVFSRALLSAMGREGKITIVTSGYHISRAETIFRFVFGPKAEILTARVDWQPGELERESELKSLKAFEKTFRGVEPGNLCVILERLYAEHPLYANS